MMAPWQAAARMAAAWLVASCWAKVSSFSSFSSSSWSAAAAAAAMRSWRSVLWITALRQVLVA